MLRLALAAVLLSALPAAAREAVDCEGELASARRLYEAQTSQRLRLADPLARAARQLIERTITDEDRALVARFARGEVGASELDRALWPKLLPALDRFNRAGCAPLGGVVRTEEIVEQSAALRGGKGLHTGVVMTCARRPLQGEARRWLGLRVKRGEQGPALALFGFVEARQTLSASAAGEEWSGLVVNIPLGDRATELAALGAAVASFTGTEEDFTWAVPSSCLPRITLR
jgi:hypothetical protein